MKFSQKSLLNNQYHYLIKYLKNVSVPKKEGGPPIEFNNDGSLKSVEIRIVNLQLDVEASKTAQTDIKKWEEIGVWQATPKKSNDVVGLGIGDGLTSAALPYNHGTYSNFYSEFFVYTVFPRIVSALEQFPPLNSFHTFMYCDQRSLSQ